MEVNSGVPATANQVDPLPYGIFVGRLDQSGAGRQLSTLPRGFKRVGPWPRPVSVSGIATVWVVPAGRRQVPAGAGIHQQDRHTRSGKVRGIDESRQRDTQAAEV